jgi:uncharacterized protein
MNREELVRQTETEVRRRLAGQGAGHGFDHIQRVVAAARQIQSEVGGDTMIVELSALLHDVGDAKFHGGIERSGELSREILASFVATQEVIEHVVHIVENISFRKRAHAEPLSLEGQIVQDADRLDALGAIGIIRTIEYGAFKGLPFYSPDLPDNATGIGHFHEKLFKLRDLMNTDTGRRLAVQREKFMRDFIEQFYQECGVLGK